MKKPHASVIDYYNREAVKAICDKYGYEPQEALRQFVCSKTHRMLEDEKCGLTDFGALGVFDIWEAERVTGDPRNSIYIRGE
jgi:hypothetical protein